MTHPYIDIHTHSKEDENGVLKVRSYLAWEVPEAPGRMFSAGVHPWSVAAAPDDALERLPANDPRLVAVGEIGLDYAAKNLDKVLQAEWFTRQLSLAEKSGLPVVIHCVRAHSDFIHIMDDFKLKGVIIHGFIGSPELSGIFLKRGYSLSFGFTALRSPKTVESIKSIPSGSLFLETDDTGGNIADIYAAVAAIRNENIEELKAEIADNFQKIIDTQHYGG